MLDLPGKRNRERIIETNRLSGSNLPLSIEGVDIVLWPVSNDKVPTKQGVTGPGIDNFHESRFWKDR